MTSTLSSTSDGEIEVGIDCCRVARTSSCYRFVPDDWIEKAAGSVTGRLVFDDDLLRLSATLDSEASIVGAVLPALLADNTVEMNKFRRLFYGYAAAVFENDGRAFVVDLILSQPSADNEGNLKPLNPENLKYSIRISEWGSASLIETARSFAKTGTVPDDDAFVLAVSASLALSIAQAQAIVAILMTTDVNLFGAFRTWSRNVEPTFLEGKAEYDFQSEAIVKKPGLLNLLPSGRYSLDVALEDVE